MESHNDVIFESQGVLPHLIDELMPHHSQDLDKKSKTLIWNGSHKASKAKENKYSSSNSGSEVTLGGDKQNRTPTLSNARSSKAQSYSKE
jgi:hypothetical protein